MTKNKINESINNRPLYRRLVHDRGDDGSGCESPFQFYSRTLFHSNYRDCVALYGPCPSFSVKRIDIFVRHTYMYIQDAKYFLCRSRNTRVTLKHRESAITNRERKRRSSPFDAC